MIEVDRLMIEKYGFELIQMMENAGRALALVAKQVFLKNDLKNKKIAVLAGTGGNGGGALVAARRLSSWGGEVRERGVRVVVVRGELRREGRGRGRID